MLPCEIRLSACSRGTPVCVSSAQIRNPVEQAPAQWRRGQEGGGGFAGHAIALSAESCTRPRQRRFIRRHGNRTIAISAVSTLCIGCVTKSHPAAQAMRPQLGSSPQDAAQTRLLPAIDFSRRQMQAKGVAQDA